MKKKKKKKKINIFFFEIHFFALRQRVSPFPPFPLFFMFIFTFFFSFFFFSEFKFHLSHFYDDRIHPSALELLFPSNSFKCNQCGRRFLHHVQEKEMELHMDWHFRMNRKAREQGSQIQSRLWFLKASVRV
ncbi:hypothetical protein HMI56_005971 [Coelomomyces lativittatus]|nr:hypothetical protein HMI56_005971 [Coelomomyces lativittatus]